MNGIFVETPENEVNHIFSWHCTAWHGRHTSAVARGTESGRGQGEKCRLTVVRPSIRRYRHFPFTQVALVCSRTLRLESSLIEDDISNSSNIVEKKLCCYISISCSTFRITVFQNHTLHMYDLYELCQNDLKKAARSERDRTSPKFWVWFPM